MKIPKNISCLVVLPIALAGCGAPSQDSQPAETVTITATPSGEPSKHAPQKTPTTQTATSTDPSGGETPASVMEASATDKNIIYEDSPVGLSITLPMTHEHEEVYTQVHSEMDRALRLLNGTDVGAHLRKIVVYSSDGMMLLQTDMPVDPTDMPIAEPSPTASKYFPNDHAPRGDDLIITPPALTPVPDVSGLSVDMSLVGTQGIRDGNYEMYLKVPKRQMGDNVAAHTIADAMAKSLKNTPVADSLKEVRVYSSDLVLLDSTPLGK